MTVDTTIEQPITIGPFVEGEIPFPLEYTFLTAAGDPIPFTEARFVYERRNLGPGVYRRRDAEPITYDAPVVRVLTPEPGDATAGKAVYEWVDADLVAGVYVGEFWVRSDEVRPVSRLITWTVRQAIWAAPDI